MKLSELSWVIAYLFAIPEQESRFSDSPLHYNHPPMSEASNE